VLLYITHPGVRSLRPAAPIHPTAPPMRDNRSEGKQVGEHQPPRRERFRLAIVSVK